MKRAVNRLISRLSNRLMKNVVIRALGNLVSDEIKMGPLEIFSDVSYIVQ